MRTRWIGCLSASAVMLLAGPSWAEDDPSDLTRLLLEAMRNQQTDGGPTNRGTIDVRELQRAVERTRPPATSKRSNRRPSNARPSNPGRSTKIERSTPPGRQPHRRAANSSTPETPDVERLMIEALMNRGDAGRRRRNTTLDEKQIRRLQRELEELNRVLGSRPR